MKKPINLFLSAVMACAMAACTGTPNPSEDGAAAPSPAQAPKKTLVAYYSRSGNTEAVAKQIAQATGGTLFQITTSHTYPKDYNKITAQVKKEIQTGFKPKLVSLPENREEYDMVFIGSPNWWGTYAPAVSSFLDAENFNGKTVAPFFTYGKGGIQNCERDMKKQLPGVNFAPAAAFLGSSSGADEKEFAAWIKQVGFAQ